jgi:hypothetical protein
MPYAMSAQQLQIAQVLGFDPKSPAVSTTNLNAAANWFAATFIAQSSSAPSKVRFYISAIAGSLGASDVTCDLYSEASGLPNASLESRNTLSSAIAAGAWAEWTGFTTALTAGTPYWLIVKNVNGTPGSNYPTIRFGSAGAGDNAIGGSGDRQGIRAATSANSGGSWTFSANSCGWRIQFADGTFQGLPASNIANSADLVYLTRESGVQFVAPVNVVLNVAGIAMYIAATTGTPAGNARFGLWTGAGGSPTNVDYTYSISEGAINGGSNNWFPALFANGTHAIGPGTTVRVTLADASPGSDDASHAYKMPEYTIDGDLNSLALIPWSMQKTYYNGSSWAQTNTALFPFALILDTTGEFAPVGPVLVQPRKIVIRPPHVTPPRRSMIAAGGSTTVSAPLLPPPRRIQYSIRYPQPRARIAAIAAAPPVMVPLRLPPRTVTRTQAARTRNAAAILPGPQVLTVFREPPRQIARIQFVRRNAGSALFSQSVNQTILVKSTRTVR